MNKLLFCFRFQIKQPLFDMDFYFIGETKQPKNEIIKKIRLMGGKIATRIHNGLTAVISNVDKVKEVESDMKDALLHTIQVVPEEFLDEVMDNDPIELIVKKDLSGRGGDVSVSWH